MFVLTETDAEGPRCKITLELIFSNSNLPLKFLVFSIEQFTLGYSDYVLKELDSATLELRYCASFGDESALMEEALSKSKHVSKQHQESYVFEDSIPDIFKQNL